MTQKPTDRDPAQDGVDEPLVPPQEDVDGYRGDGRSPKARSIVAMALFHTGWFFVVPALVALSRRFWLAALPESGFTETLRGQPIPVAIVLFTVAAMILWGQRYTLPGAASAGVGGRPGLAPSVRKAFDRARALREEARAIRRAHGKEIARTLREEHRKELEVTLTELARAMDAATFDEPAFQAAFDKAEEVVDARLGRFRKSEAREYAESILVAVMVALGIRAFVIEAFKIPSGSMIPTLLVGDHIFVNKLA